MQAEYRREIDGNYLVVQVQEGQPEDYTLQMLSYNQPESFLHLKTSELNGHPVLMYEVTSMQPVGRIFERSGVGKEQMELMLNGLTLVLEDARKYLLSPSDLVLDPDHIYYDPGRKNIRFIYLPANTDEEDRALRSLAEFLLRHLDHKDPQAVSLGYAFYDRCSDDATSLAGIVEELGSREIHDGNRTDETSFQFGSRDRAGADNTGKAKHRYVGKPEENRWDISVDETATPQKNEDNRKKNTRSDKTGIADKWDRWRKDKRNIRQMLFIIGISFACSVTFALIVWLGKLDVTQTGGLFFGMIAMAWLVLRLVSARKKPREFDWNDDLADPDEEDAYFQALINEVYAKAPQGADTYGFTGASAQVNGQERSAAREMKELPEEEDSSDFTRALSIVNIERKLWLISEDMHKCRDLAVEAGTVRIGKKQELVDLCIPLDVISRVHAQIRQSEEGVFLQDLNSTNGTSVNGQMLEPMQERKIQEGDIVAFSTIRFTVRFKEFNKTV